MKDFFLGIFIIGIFIGLWLPVVYPATVVIGYWVVWALYGIIIKACGVKDTPS
jgi:hypothetical protein